MARCFHRSLPRWPARAGPNPAIPSLSVLTTTVIGGESRSGDLREEDLRRRPSGGVLNRLGRAGRKYVANPGLTPSFRRSLPETGCLSQGLPHGKRYAWPCPPKPLSAPEWPELFILPSLLPRRE